jgi:hypothetical protein
MSGIVRCAVTACMKPVAIAMQFPADPALYPYPYCVSHAVVVARAFQAEEAKDGDDKED